MKKITVLLTKYSDWTSEMIYRMSGHGYTHASLGLGDEPDTYYSFNFKGFCKETAEKHRSRGVTVSLSYELEVSEQSYAKICQRIQEFQAKREQLHYTRLGAFLCLLRIPFCWKGHYFCSQFVAETLQCTGALTLCRRPVLCRPNDLAQELPGCGRLLKMQTNPI